MPLGGGRQSARGCPISAGNGEEGGGTEAKRESPGFDHLDNTGEAGNEGGYYAKRTFVGSRFNRFTTLELLQQTQINLSNWTDLGKQCGLYQPAALEKREERKNGRKGTERWGVDERWCLAADEL